MKFQWTGELLLFVFIAGIITAVGYMIFDFNKKQKGKKS
jgi:hypothetical protein